MRNIDDLRNSMKSRFALHAQPRVDNALRKKLQSDQSRGVPPPPVQKPYDPNAPLVNLPKPNKSVLTQNDLYACMRQRRSRREFSRKPLSLDELAFLLWATQGIDELIGNYASLRPSPSGGARHPLETYLLASRVAPLDEGVYRYLPVSHQLLFEFRETHLRAKITDATLGQSFVGDSAVVFVWTCIPYRCEWRYPLEAHKLILLDAGHVCQNLYLACEAIGCATCAVGAYDQDAMDRLLRLDGNEEFVIYLAPVGKA